MSLRPGLMAVPVSLAPAGLIAGCATMAVPAGGLAYGSRTIEGTVAAIDTTPWTYDGHAVVEVDVPGTGRVPVQLPARWNLCKAQAVDVQALAVGMRVRATGTQESGDALTVCGDASHQLVLVPGG